MASVSYRPTEGTSGKAFLSCLKTCSDQEQRACSAVTSSTAVHLTLGGDMFQYLHTKESNINVGYIVCNIAYLSKVLR